MLRRLRRATLARPAPRGRAGRAGGARALPARPGTGSTGAPPCARRSCRSRPCRSRSPLGERGAAAPRAGLPAGRARRALRQRRGRLGGRRARPRRASTSATTRRSSARPRAASRPQGDVHDAIRAALARERRVLARSARGHGARGGRGAAGAVGARLGGRGDERRLGAAARRAPLRRARPPNAGRAASRARGRPATSHRGPLVADGAALRRRRPAIRTGARSPSSCSSGRGSSRGTVSAARGSPAATARSTASCARSRRSAPAGAATSSTGSAERSSRSRAPSSGCASCARARTPMRSCSRPPIPPSRTAPSLPWPKRAGARAARVAGAHVVLLGGEAALYVERGGRTLVPLREPEEVAAARARRARGVGAAGHGSASPSSASTAGPSPRPRRCRCSSRPASSPARGAPCSGRRGCARADERPRGEESLVLTRGSGQALRQDHLGESDAYETGSSTVRTSCPRLCRLCIVSV